MACDCCGSVEWDPLFAENGVRLGRCPDCDLLYVDDIPDPSRRMTEMEEGHYAGSLSIVEADRQSRSERILAERFAGYVDLARRFVEGGRWLDIGCGAGVMLQQAQRAGFEAEGVELSGDRRRIAEQITGVTVHGVPVEEAGLADRSVDVVSMINVFSHLVSPRQTFGELRRILRPGGVIVMVTGEMTAGIAQSHMLHWNLGDHLYFLGDRTMGEYARRLRLEVLHHRRTWMPEAMFSREWLRLRGRSRLKNAVKSAIDATPGGLALLRAVMLRRQADSAAHTSEFVLRPSPASGL